MTPSFPIVEEECTQTTNRSESMSLRLNFLTLDVFTSTPYAGNPLAIVHVPAGVVLSPAQKLRITREFNLSETVFLHEPQRATASSDPPPYALDIFTCFGEVPWAGHPTIGTAWYLLVCAKPPLAPGDLGDDPSAVVPRVTLATKAGVITAYHTPAAHIVHFRVPADFRVHESVAHADVKPAQVLQHGDYVNGMHGLEPVVSIVKGMTYMLVELTSEEALARMQPFQRQIALPEGHLGEWGGFVGLYAFYRAPDGVVKARMFTGTLEDPATGSAAAALAGWLALEKGPGKWKTTIIQGADMGRESAIGIAADIGDDGNVQGIALVGSAVQVMEGTLRV